MMKNLSILFLLLSFNSFSQATEDCPVNNSSSPVLELEKTGQKINRKLDGKLFEAIEECDIKKIKKHIAHGANVNALNSSYNDQTDRYTPLIFAVRKSCTEGVRLLLDNGADSNFNRTTDSNTALMIAARQPTQSVEMVKILLEEKYKTNINATSAVGRSALVVAAFNTNIEVMKLLLDKSGIDLNAASIFDTGATALGIAARQNNEAMVDLILNHRTDDIKPIWKDKLKKASSRALYNKNQSIIDKIDAYEKAHYPN